MSDSAQTPRNPQRQGTNWELDADELDRYMSGQPAKEPRFDPYGRSQPTGRTQQRTDSRQQQPAQPHYEDYEEVAAPSTTEWADDDYGYEEDYGYDEYQSEPEPEPARQRERQPRRATRARQHEPEYEDDLYDDPYVLDDEEAPRRPQRQQQRPARARQTRPSAGFTVPRIIAEAPLVKDRMALGMLAGALVSVLAMLIVVATRRDGLDASIFTHVNANGEPANIQSASAIWNLPLIAAMVTLIGGIAAWFLARWGEFLPRFLIGGSIGVQFVVWIAVIAYLF